MARLRRSIIRDMASAYIAMGSNLGDRRATIDRSLVALRSEPGVTICNVSSLIETASVGGPADAPPFLNGVASLRTDQSPRTLLDTLLRIERQLGRVRSERNAPRTIDLDLLLFDDLVINDDDLILPHPRLQERRFVLQPLHEIAPDLVLPDGKLIATLLQQFCD